MAHRTFIWALLVASWLAAGETTAADLKVWVVDDGVRVNPQTGKALEDSELYPETLRIKPGSRAACLHTSSVLRGSGRSYVYHGWHREHGGESRMMRTE